MALTVREYETAEGEVPFRDWLATSTERPELGSRRVSLARDGNLGDYESVGSGVQEARVMFGAGYRIYFGQHGTVAHPAARRRDQGDAGQGHPPGSGYWRDYLEEK